MARKMLKSHHLAILALVLALGIATPIVVATLSEDESARAANETSSEEDAAPETVPTETDTPVTDTLDTPADNPESTPAAVTSFDAFKEALADPDQATITLGTDIELSEPLTISRDLTLDLATHKITVATGVNSAFIIRQGDVTITGEEGSGIAIDTGVALWVYGSKTVTDTDFTHLTVGQNVLITASSTNDSSYGIAVNRFDSENNVAYGVKIDFDGRIGAYNGITILGHIRHTDNAPAINLGGNAVITAQGPDDSMALYAAGYGIWNVGAANLVGSSALGVKSGQFTFTNTTMAANGARQDDVETGNSGIAGSGATFQIEDNSVYAGGIQITINDGKYSSQNGHVFYEYDDAARAASPLEKITINSGTFEAGADSSIFSGVNAGVVTLAGGSYNKEIAKEYLGENQQLVEKDGVWTIQDTTTGEQPGTNPKPDEEGDDNPEKPTDKPQAKPDDNAPGTGAHNITSQISAIATTTTAIAVGALVFLAFALRLLIRHRSDKSQPSAKTSREVKNSRTKVADKTSAKSSKTAKSATKAAPKAKSTKTTKTAKSTAKTATKKPSKTSKARK